MEAGLPNQFKRGDVVRITSGGPYMTVETSEGRSDGTVYCIWFNDTGSGHELKGHSFQPETLKAER